jgi:DNA topoisomerase-1
MRTDSRNYCAEFLQEVRKWVLDKYIKTEYVGAGSQSNADETAHEAIRVTHLEMATVEGLPLRVKKLYEFIWKNTIASCMSAAKIEQTPVYMSCPQIYEKTPIQYVHLIDRVAFMGWTALYPQPTMDENLFYMSSCPKEQKLIMATAKVAVHGRHSHYTEASLIKKLEDIGIGRPSTYASLVEVLLDRGYVKKMDIEGDVLSCSEYVLKDGDIKEEKIEKKVGQEKGKLVIQPTGILVAEFLTENFGPLFDYGYTEAMEKDLDEMARGNCHKDICLGCHHQIESLIGPVEKKRFVLADTDEYSVVFGRFGAVIQHITNKKDFRTIRAKLDMDRLRKGEYSLAELEEKREEVLGEHEGHSVILLNGPFGKYIKYKDENVGLKSILENEVEEGIESIDLYDKFVKWISKPVEKENTKIIRELADGLSIRNGKYGAYIHHETKEMKKPKFYKLKGFKESYRLCQKEVILDWIRENYQIG